MHASCHLIKDGWLQSYKRNLQQQRTHFCHYASPKEEVLQSNGNVRCRCCFAVLIEYVILAPVCYQVMLWTVSIFHLLQLSL